ncbi:MAG: serine/threonine protein kinase, partial [Deltaproteobacteria bacterium]|nr:serine/threonine protein kinase [Deltaproteobacteria bacterium]
MSSDPEDELARTATAPGSSPSQGAAAPIGQTLGRYRLERELGSGGMGVVHAAFDPDLERRVALKVLRSVTGGSEARQRLLREARAMARLAHPNVVTVHEVGSADGRDYVAMEIVDGQTLAEWVRSAPRGEDEIVEAFIGAGRGLAAAHAAGIVHRDFKPHNVLRHRNGRIVVTDFGLAREAQEAPNALAITQPLRGRVDGAVSTSTPSSPLAGLTMTGSVLGTPAYMAPEQWSGGNVTPATDQFAFCVALWEALAGERPFRGATQEVLRAEVERGPAELDASKIPRRLRPALLRGLDPIATRRWPSMEALLEAMAPPRHEPRAGRSMVLVLGSSAIVAAAVVFAIVRGRGSEPAVAVVPPPCRAPALDPAIVWPEDAATKLVAMGQRPAADQLAVDAHAWRAARTRACA